jgi:polyferredoxin
LREAVKLAALFAEAGEVRHEHIFTGPKQEGLSTEIDLTRSSALRWLLKGSRLHALRLAVFASFVAVTVLCLTAASVPEGRLSNALVWGLWEPALILLFLVAGRVWCTVCPLATAGQVAKALTGGMDRSPPAWMKKGGLLIASAGFAGIIWIEQVFHMTSRPHATGYLLAALMGLAMFFAVVYQREVWCRYLCPLGMLGASLTAPAVLQVRANASVCGTNCKTHECFKGSASQAGCSVFHHPLYASDSHACKLCLNCITVCPHGSARLYLRMPFQAVWGQLGLSGALAPFSLSIFALSLVMLVYQETLWIGRPVTLSALAGLCVTVGYGLSAVLPKFLVRGGEGGSETTGRIGFALMVLAWGPLMAYQLKNIPLFRGLTLELSDGSPLQGIIPSGGMPLLLLFQSAAVLAALAGAMLVLWKVRRRLQGEGARPQSWGWGVLYGASLVYAVIAIVSVAEGAAPQG